MSLYSMTGFGRAEVLTKKGYRIMVELSSVNRKQFDCNLSIPHEFAVYDSKMQSLINRVVNRGYVKGSINVDLLCAAAEGVDLATLQSQVETLRNVARQLGLEDDLKASDLLRMPELMKSRAALKAEMLWPEVEKTLTKALSALKQMRQSEGKVLEVDLLKRFEALRVVSRKISTLALKVPTQYKKSLERRLKNLLASDVEVDRELIAREIAVFADRCDVSEELTRLESHFEQVFSTIERGGACGRRLDFICQELFREINTTGAKANNAKISELVIDFKAGLEAAREQVQNIE